MTPRPGPEQTRTYAEHILYEVWMAGGLVARFLYHRTILDDPATAPELETEIEEIGRNADVGSFVIHARGLLDFFYSDNRRKRRAIAADYFTTDAEWEAIRPPQSAALRSLPGRAGSEVAHLGYRRTTPARNWSYLDIWRDLAPIVRLFVENADRARLGDDVPRGTRALLAHLDELIVASTAPTITTPSEWPGPGWTVVHSSGTATVMPSGPIIPTGR